MATTSSKPNTGAKNRAMVRVSDTAHQMLRELSDRYGEPMHAIIEKAVDAYRRERFFDELDAGYAALQSDPEAWQEELAERKLWEATLMDGLEDE
jgi:hypothetical protein